MSAVRRGQEHALKAERALQSGNVEEAKAEHKEASNAFKEAREALPECDVYTKQALAILIDHHRELEKNPGIPKPTPPPNTARARRGGLDQVPELLGTAPSRPKRTMADADAAVQEYSEFVAKTTQGPPPLAEPTSRLIPPEWRRTNSNPHTQSMLMAESYCMVPEPTTPTGQGPSHKPSQMPAPSTVVGASQSCSADKLQSNVRLLMSDVERLTKENESLRATILRERDESRKHKERFWKMFASVKATLEDVKGAREPAAANYEPELKALTKAFHEAVEGRKRAEAELQTLKQHSSPPCI